VALGVLIVALLVATVFIARELHDSAKTSYLDRVIPLRTAALDLELDLVDEETGVRGYVITGDRTSLVPYAEGRTRASAAAHVLQSRADRDSRLAPLLLPVVRLRAQLNGFFASEVRLVATGEAPNKARAAARVESGTTIFDAFRTAVARIQAYAASQTAQAQRRQDSLFRRLTTIVGAAGITAMAIVAVLAWLVPERAFGLLTAERRASAEAERLRVETEALQALTADLSSASTVDDVHTALARTGQKLLEADALSIGVLDPARDAIEVWTHGFPRDADPGPPRIGRDAIRDGRARFVESDGADSSFRALAALPLGAPGELPHGYLGIHYRSERVFLADERTRMRVIAGEVESALLRAESHDRERRTAESLQRALLPAALPRPGRAQLVGYYRPGSEGTLVGGDWYDAVELEDGTIAGSVGDVAGHGIPAAAQMGRLRHSYRAYALEHRSPAEALARLTRHVNVDGMATAVCFDVQPATRRLRYCRAGHPPPIVLDLERGEITMLDAPGATPLGFAEPGDFADTIVQLGRRSLLFAYTDGLVEQRKTGLGERLGLLVERIAATEPGDLEVYVASIVAEMAGGEGNPDDIAVLAILV
jgi:serine phosphatase RsbU (regulator of sigma subunit)/CHASE3 domain sensor protein